MFYFKKIPHEELVLQKSMQHNYKQWTTFVINIYGIADSR